MDTSRPDSDDLQHHSLRAAVGGSMAMGARTTRVIAIVLKGSGQLVLVTSMGDRDDSQVGISCWRPTGGEVESGEMGRAEAEGGVQCDMILYSKRIAHLRARLKSIRVACVPARILPCGSLPSPRT
jgi:hypothetical protein